MDPKSMLLPVIVPALLAGGFLAVGWRLWRRDRREQAGPWVEALALVLAVLAARLLVLGLPSFPPAESAEWLPFLALAALVPGALERKSAPVRVGSWVLVATAVVGLSLQRIAKNWSTGEALLGLPALVLAAVLVIAVLARAAREVEGVALPALFWLLAAGSAAVIGVSGGATLAQVGGGLAAGLGALAVGTLLAPARPLVRGAAPVTGIVLATLWVDGAFLLDTPRASSILLAVAPLAALLGVVGPTKRLGYWPATALRLVLALVPIGIALGLAVHASPPLEGE